MMTMQLYLPNKKGLKLATVVELPEETGKFPSVLLLHGFKGYKEEDTYIDLAKKLAERGIASIRFDASGFGESEGSTEEEYRFSNFIQDTECVYEWLQKQPFFDSSRFGVCGQSIGGCQTLLFCSNHPEVKAACPISNPDIIGTKDGLGRKRKEWQEQGFLEEKSSKYGLVRFSYEYLLDAERFNFCEIAKKVHCPLLFFVGGKDETVLPEQTKAVFEAANEPKELVEIAEMDHFYKRNPKILEKVNILVSDFFEDKLK
jgi:dienelactone hydrolase